jgi:hypothetical protein
MARRAHLYQSLYGLFKNPFPEHAIATAADGSQPFYDGLHPGIAATMARAFIGHANRMRSVAFLWALGEGEDARGYGKTRHLLWFANLVNGDFGQTVEHLMGSSREHSGIFAIYSTFSTVDGLTLSSLLFDAVRDSVIARAGELLTLRNAAVGKGDTVDNVYGRAAKLLNDANEPWDFELLWHLCHYSPTDWRSYLSTGFGQWHKVRVGRQMFRSLVAFLRALGTSRVLLLVDQVEDFANWSTSSYKLKRDFSRLAYLCTADVLLRDQITFVLTMHPNAARVLSWYWQDRALGPVSTNERQGNVVLLRNMRTPQFVEMARAYLASARSQPTADTLHPFTVEALEYVCEREKGRPGYCLSSLHRLIEAAVDEAVKLIDRARAAELLG